ncbi:MAG: hypothetical protein AUK16_02065 [Parcubacteria group bacterium CG2_30_44_11]|nr:MAG: hypothetical protein AUK16_02065 [Parcubacteria group bacterium CG2_30_44_11]
MSNFHRKLTVTYFVKNFGIIVGIVLVWRGIWYVMDVVDLTFFGGKHIYTAIGGIIAGFLILYIPDKDLKEIEKL